MKNLVSEVYPALKRQMMFLILCLLFSVRGINAQTTPAPPYTKVGIALGSFVSGNGHGTIYSPQLSLNNKRSSVLFGPCFQKRAMQFNGARVAFSFVLNSKPSRTTDDDEEDDEEPYQYFGGEIQTDGSKPAEQEMRVNFKLYVYAEYLKENLLSQSTQKMEAHVNRVEGQNWGKTKLNTIEGGVGVQVGVRLAKNIYWNTFIAASFYYHTKYVPNMHHEQYSPCLTLGTNITLASLKIFN